MFTISFFAQFSNANIQDFIKPLTFYYSSNTWLSLYLCNTLYIIIWIHNIRIVVKAFPHNCHTFSVPSCACFCHLPIPVTAGPVWFPLSTLSLQSPDQRIRAALLRCEYFRFLQIKLTQSFHSTSISEVVCMCVAGRDNCSNYLQTLYLTRLRAKLSILRLSKSVLQQQQQQ